MHGPLDTSLPIMAVAIAAGVAAGTAMWKAAGWRAGVLFGLAALIPGMLARDWAVATAMAIVSVLAWRWRCNGTIDAGDTRGISLQVLLVAAGYLVYQIGRVLLRAGEGPAIANAHEIVAFEQALHIWTEPGVQDALSRGFAREAFNVFYRSGFHPIPVMALMLFYLRDRQGYFVLRNSFAVSAAIGLVLIAAFPAAPPRLVPGLGIVDTIEASGDARMLANKFAAIPSFHVGWPVLVGVLVAIRARGPWRFLALLPAALMAVTVVVTGNHYWVDGPIGATISVLPALVLLSIIDARRRSASSSERRPSRAAGSESGGG